jgi:uncharacterized protein (TIGR03086 family)
MEHEQGTRGTDDVVEVVEYTDPICSWAWGSEPKLRLLQWQYGHRMRWRTVMGGLVHDASAGQHNWDGAVAAEPMSKYWRRSSAYTNQPYPMPMHRMARSTDPAGRAVLAARFQGNDIAAAVLRRFRESTFLFGATPETKTEFRAAAMGVAGLDVDRWLREYDSAEAISAYQADWDETSRPNDHVRFLAGDWVGIGSMKNSNGRERYAFPTLIFRRIGGDASEDYTVPGWMPFEAYVEALESADPGATRDPRPGPSVAEAFARWGVFTENELEIVCGANAANDLPADVVSYFWGAGLVYFSSQEAVSRGLPPISVPNARALADFAHSMEIAYQLVRQVPDEAWGLPTPCSEWNLRALVNHMIGSARMVSFGLRGDLIGPEFYGNHLGPDPVVSYRNAIDEVIALYRRSPMLLDSVIAMPWGSLTGAELAIMFAGDHLVHAWDVARSLGLPTDFDHKLIARIRIFGDGYVARTRGPGMFSEAVEAADDANPMDRFAAFIGRG